MTVAARLAHVQREIEVAAARAGRDPATVQLVAVSKGHRAAAIAEAYAAGQRVFGESYAQEMLKKQEILDGSCPDIEWHFIGRVQRNKAALLARTALVHGVGARRHLEALAAARPGAAPVRALLQINAGGEGHRNGFSFSELRREMKALRAVDGTAVLGLMTIPPPAADPGEIFRRIRELRDELEAAGEGPLPELSMGMSGDFEDAITAGATLVRIGTAIFGARSPTAEDA